MIWPRRSRTALKELRRHHGTRGLESSRKSPKSNTTLPQIEPRNVKKARLTETGVLTVNSSKKAPLAWKSQARGCRVQSIRYHSLFEIDKPVRQRIVIVEIRGQGELLVQLNYCPVSDDTRTRP